MLRFSLCLSAILVLALTGCQKENQFDCFKSTGKIVKVTRPLPEFNTLWVKDDTEIILVQDTEYFVEIEAGDNLTDNILTEMDGQDLTIRNINKCNWVRSYKPKITVTVHAPHLQNIFHDGTRTVRTEGRFKARHLFLHQTGAGDYNMDVDCKMVWLDMYEYGNMQLKGTTDSLSAFMFSFGNLQAGELKAREATIIMNSTCTGEATVQVTLILNATIAGIGNLYYSGKPAVKNIVLAGKGKAIQSF